LFLQFDHIGGLNTLLECLSRGNTISLSQSKSPATVIELIEKNQVHVLPTTPSYLNLLMSNSSFDSKKLKSLKLITYGTEPVVEETLVRLKKHLPKCRIKQTFGTTELGILPVNSLSATSTAISFDNESYETKIENGTLWVKSKKRALSNLKGETSAEWHNTHDKVIDLKNGYFKLIGNETSVINVGGNKVSALEIENHIMKLPNVVDCTVYAEKNPLIGEFVVCDVILNSEQPPKEASSNIKKHCANSLKSYQVPVKVNCVTELRHSNRFKKLR
jgi:acyl-coenzyme A synthetase/AMP-(fatty) acid ligase